MWAAIVLVLLYLGAVVLPLVLVTLFGHHGTRTLTYEIGRSFALAGFCIIALQPLLAARLKWIERPFGLDIVSRFHKSMGIFAALLVVLHPPLLALGGAGLSLLFSTDVPWYIWAGKAAAFLLVIHVALSIASPAFPVKFAALDFEQWRWIHTVIAPGIVIVGFVHAWQTGSDFALLSMQLCWIAALTIFFAAFVFHKFIKPAALRRKPYTVVEVTSNTPDVWTVKFAPPEGERVFHYDPGQFHFITLHRGHGLPVEEHHWTISSSPSRKDFISSTIKESGDFTATIGKTTPGDKAVIQGPFGRFSYVLHPEDKNIVFIAGGIGITPIMSMLRHMNETQANIDALLIYANRSEEDIVFRKELDAIQSNAFPRLKVIHVLSNPGRSWNGEKGRLDREKLKRLVDRRINDHAFYLCGPPPMTAAMIAALWELGVPMNRIRTERFSL